MEELIQRSEDILVTLVKIYRGDPDKMPVEEMRTEIRSLLEPKKLKVL